MEDSKPLYPHHESLTIENFTCFEKAEFQFSPGINVFVGENGTGKTHVLKILYAFMNDHRSGVHLLLHESKLERCFNGYDLLKLTRKNQDPDKTFVISGVLNGSSWSSRVESDFDEEVGMLKYPVFTLPRKRRGQDLKSVFIPVVDVAGNIGNLLKLDSTYKINWDQIQIDLAKHLNSLELKNLSKVSIALESEIINLLGGELELIDDSFWLQTNQGSYRLDHVADGYKKLATLLRLIQVGALQSGSCLFWDEPEANLNPSLMDEVVRAVLLLAKSGVQVFLATHSYIILKELEVQAQNEDQIKFFGFEKSENGTKIHEAIRYRDIKPNLIEDQYGSLLERAFEKDFKRGA